MKEMATMLSFEEAVNFIENELEIANVQERLQEQKHQFLDDIIRSFYGHIAFTTFHLHSTKISERRFPHPDTIIKEVMTKKAGTCSMLNGFFHHLLRALDYEAIITNGEVLGGSIPNNHVVILVKNLDNENDLHYVDVGIGLPTFKAISLGDLPKTCTFAFHKMRIEKTGDKYTRYHRKIFDLAIPEDENNEWKAFIEFGTVARELDFFNEAMETVYCSVEKGILNKFLLGFLYPNSKAIILKQLTLRIWDEETKNVEVTEFQTTEEALSELPKYFPMIDKKVMKQALTFWKEIELPQHTNALI